MEAADRLYTLAEIADVVVDDAVQRAGADSGALLVPDGPVWRVAAGIGMRPLEFRYQLTAESWLVERVSASGRGILVEDTDVARRHLQGAPLASRTHILAVPVVAVGAILLLSRDQDPPFTEDVLGQLAVLANEAGPLLKRAIDVRTLARALARHTDPVEIPHD
jgi:GAF domain-containing protein